MYLYNASKKEQNIIVSTNRCNHFPKFLASRFGHDFFDLLLQSHIIKCWKKYKVFTSKLQKCRRKNKCFVLFCLRIHHSTCSHRFSFWYIEQFHELMCCIKGMICWLTISRLYDNLSEHKSYQNQIGILFGKSSKSTYCPYSSTYFF